LRAVCGVEGLLAGLLEGLFESHFLVMTEGEKEALSAFLKKSVNLEHLEALINEAKNVMGVGGDARAFRCPSH
jgi:hypothetical protein